MQFYEINICQVMRQVFRLYIAYNKREMIKIGNQTREKSQVYASAGIILLSTVTTESIGIFFVT